ncbi:MAG: phosphoribosylanthranilate isomerase [Planctomycetota bacterium]|nr:phosphoribosylanthranilate isomerase [Planctomycetota bacterium]
MTVKVCGLRTPEEVACALEAGADLVGFVHHPPSPRHLDWDALAEVLRVSGAASRAVLVTVDASPEPLAARSLELGVAAVQLCGSEDPAAFSAFPVRVLRRLAVAPGAAEEARAWSATAEVFVLDHPSGAGGTGLAVDLDEARALCAQLPCLVAGGLTPESVGAVLRATGARGADASSGLEAAPGVKDARRVRAFVTAARAALGEVQA